MDDFARTLFDRISVCLSEFNTEAGLVTLFLVLKETTWNLHFYVYSPGKQASQVRL